MDGVYKDLAGRLLYDPKEKVAKYDMDLEFYYRNLTDEQLALAAKIINEKNKGYGFSVVCNILDALTRAGFRGEVQCHTDPMVPICIVINSKIDK